MFQRDGTIFNKTIRAGGSREMKMMPFLGV